MSRALASRSLLPLSVNHKVDHAPTSPRKSAGKVVSIGKPPMPSREDYLKAFARLVWATYGSGSLEETCKRATRETRLASPDTWARIIGTKTQKPDAYVVDYVRHVATKRGIAIPAELRFTLPDQVAQ